MSCILKHVDNPWKLFECTDLALTSKEQAQDVEIGNVPSEDG